MATPETPTDMEVSICELGSDSAGQASSASTLVTPASLMSMVSLGTDYEAEDEAATLLSACGTAASGAPVSMEEEFTALDATNGWPQAYREVADRCHDYPYHAARDWENRSRNRYKDVNPYDHSRVHLQPSNPAPGGSFNPDLGSGAGASCSSSASSSFADLGDLDDSNDYINASFVLVAEAPRSYILTQGPLPNTCGHFWLMVWQQSSKAVIMLNQLEENNMIKCSQYWPHCQGQSLLFKETGIRVHMLGEEVKPYYTIRLVRLENVLLGEFRSVSHFHYTGWPDFGVPESPASFLDFLFMVRETGSLSYEPGPAVIHCSAGIGRSGTFALIDACLVLMEKRENPFSLNIRQVLVGLRKYRMGLIQTPEQLRFSYMAVIEGAKFLMGDENIKKKWEELTKEDHARSYSFDSSPPPSGMINRKYKAFKLILDDDDDDDNEGTNESDYSDLAVRLPDSDSDSDSEDESSDGATLKRGREECKASSSSEGSEKPEIPAKRRCKRKRLNLQDL